MNLEWIDPPRTDYDDLRDQMDTAATELHQHPGAWARIASGVGRMDCRRSELLEERGIEVRHHYANPHDQHLMHGTYDLYARAPKEAE